MSAPRRVLVSGGDPYALLLDRVTLEAAGCEVIEAAGDDLLQTIREAGPDLVLVDVSGAGNDSWAPLVAIKNDPSTSQTPVVILGGNAEEDQLRAWSGGAAEYVTRPFPPGLLVHVVEDVLATSPEEEQRRREILGRILGDADG